MKYFLSVIHDIQQRYVLTLMAFLALSNAYAMRTNLSMTITRMVAASSVPTKMDRNHSQWVQLSPVCSRERDDTDYDAKFDPQNQDFMKPTDSHHHFQWSQEMQGIILGAFYVGYLLSHLPGGLLAQKYGGKYILGFGVLTSGVLSMLIPVCVDYGGAHSLIAIRMLMGMFQGPIIPACMNLFSSWIPLKERCTMLSLVYSGISVSLSIHSN